MSRREKRRRLIAGSRRALTGGASSYEHYVASLNPLLWLAMTGTGATELNKGTAGAALNGTIANMGNQAIAGKIAADSAHLWNANNSLITVPNDASINALAAFTYVTVSLPFSRGENAAQRWWTWSTTTSDDTLLKISADDTDITYQRGAATTNALSRGSFTRRVVDHWQVFFVTFDDNGDRKARIYAYTETDGFEEASYIMQTAAVGALDAHNETLKIGNRTAGDRTIDGLKDAFLLFGSVLPAAQNERIGKLALARRWNSYVQKLLEMNAA